MIAELKEYTIGSVCSRLSSGKGIPASQVFDSGAYPVYGGNGLRGFTDHSNFVGECAIIGRQGAFCGNVRYFSGEAYMTEHAVVMCANESHNTRYLAYLLSTMNLGRLSGQSAQPGLSVKTLSRQTVKLPSKDSQDQIVSILAALDSKIDANNKINENLYELKGRDRRHPVHQTLVWVVMYHVKQTSLYFQPASIRFHYVLGVQRNETSELLQHRCGLEAA